MLGRPPVAGAAHWFNVPWVIFGVRKVLVSEVVVAV